MKTENTQQDLDYSGDLIAKYTEAIECLKGMMDAFAWNVEKTVYENGINALQSDVRRAYEFLKKRDFLK